MRIVLKCLGVGLLICLVTNFSKAQEVYLEIKTDFNAGNLKYRADDNIVGEQAEMGEVRNFSIAASAQIMEHLFIKSSLATSNFDSRLDIQWNNFGTAYSIDGNIRGQQTVFELLPEIRFFRNNWLFANAGIGIVDLTQGNLYKGTASIDGATWDLKDFRGYYHHFAFNVGANIQYGLVGAIIELGYRNSGYLETKDAPFRMGFEQISAKLGISYRLRDAKKKVID